MTPSEKDAARARAQDLLAARRGRTQRIRTRVAAITAAIFIALFGTIYVQMASGNDPALSAQAGTETSASTSSGTSSSGSSGTTTEEQSSDDASSSDDSSSSTSDDPSSSQSSGSAMTTHQS